MHLLVHQYKVVATIGRRRYQKIARTQFIVVSILIVPIDKSEHSSSIMTGMRVSTWIVASSDIIVRTISIITQFHGIFGKGLNRVSCPGSPQFGTKEYWRYQSSDHVTHHIQLLEPRKQVGALHNLWLWVEVVGLVSGWSQVFYVILEATGCSLVAARAWCRGDRNLARSVHDRSTNCTHG